MSQPKWKLLWSTDYSALFVDETDVYAPELQIAQEYETESGKTKFQIFRFSVDKQKEVRKGNTIYIVPEHYKETHPHPIHQYEEWFIKDLKGVASSVGSSVEELLEQLTSDNPSTRSGAYEAIGGYHGFMNFDQYPETWTEKKMDKDWP